MRRWLSIGYLPLRTTVFPVTGLLALVLLVEAAALRLAWWPDRGLEALLRAAKVPGIFAAAVLALTALMMFRGGGRLTLERLNVGPAARLLLWGIWNALCLWALMAVQILAFLLTAMACTRWGNPAVIGPQTAALTVYGSSFWYSLLPLAEPARYLCSAAACLGVGFTAAMWNFFRCRRERSVAVFVSLWLALYGFSASPADGTCYVFAVLQLLLVVYTLYRWRKASHEKD